MEGERGRGIEGERGRKVEGEGGRERREVGDEGERRETPDRWKKVEGKEGDLIQCTLKHS